MQINQCDPFICANHSHRIAPNLLGRDFDQTARPVWLADITYVPTGEGWLYVASVMDLRSRRIVGWSTADHLRAELPIDALRQALQQRHADDRRSGESLLHHSDRGVQYACDAYQDRL